MNLKQRQALIDRKHNQLSLVRQCSLLDISRASLYYQRNGLITLDGSQGHLGLEGWAMLFP